MGREDYAVEVGGAADLVVWDARGPAETVAIVAPALLALKRGQRTFTREMPVPHWP